jgi:hypothetical protein
MVQRFEIARKPAITGARVAFLYRDSRSKLLRADAREVDVNSQSTSTIKLDFSFHDSAERTGIEVAGHLDSKAKFNGVGGFQTHFRNRVGLPPSWRY